MRYFALSVCLIATSATAQSGRLVVPAAAEFLEGAGSLPMPGLSSNGLRLQQLFISADQLQSARSRPLAGVALRRDTQSGRSFAGQRGQLTLRIGATTRAPHEAASDPSLNLPNPTTVFQNAFDLPASAGSAGFRGFDASHAVQLPFDRPWLYPGGQTLVIELETGAAPAGSRPGPWEIDAAEPSHLGNVSTPAGRTCGPFGNGDGITNALVAGSLTPGATATFAHRVDSPSVMALGTRLLAQPVDLSVIGASGCSVYIDSLGTVPATAAATSELGAEFGSLVNASLRLPYDPNLFNSQLVTQWVDFTLPIRTSNAVVCTLAAAFPLPGLATVTLDEGMTVGDVSLTHFPVIRLSFH